MPLNKFNLQTLGQLYLDQSQTLTISDAYNQVGFFRRAVDIRRNGVANMPFDLLQGETEIVNEQTLEATELPLPIDVFGLIPTWATDLDLYGAAYGILLTDEFALTGEGWVRIHPSRVTPQYNHRDELIHWNVRISGGFRPLPVERLLYIWQPNQTSDRGHGKPLGEAALTAAGVLNFSGIFQSMFFEKGAITPTIASIEGFNKNSPTQKSDVRARFKRLLGGINKAHEVQVVDGKTTITTLQQNLKDMALAELSKEQKETVSATLGVPLSLIMSNAANYATATQDDFNFYDKAISPQVKDVIAKQLNKKLLNPLGYSLSYQPTRLDAFQAIELQKSETLNGMLDRKVIDLNEYRETMGLPPRDDLEEPEEETLQDKLAVMQEAVKSGFPPEQAAKLVGLTVTGPQVQGTETTNELKKWRKMAVKRYLEGNPEKALTFESGIIPEGLSDKIKSALATVTTVDSVKTIFEDARLYGGN